MERTAAQEVKAALEALTIPKAPSPLSIEAEAWDWQWSLVGNETVSEVETLGTMLRAAKAFISDVVAGGEPRWLTFLGNPGSGKTHLADRIRWFLRNKGPEIYEETVRAVKDPQKANYLSCYAYAQEGAILAKWGAIIEKLRSCENDLYRKACGDYFKIIDDLGVDSFGQDGRATPFAVQKMAELLDRRLGKWTVITSNFSRSELAKQFDSRIASRLLRGDSVIVDCGDIRDFGLRREAGRKAA